MSTTIYCEYKNCKNIATGMCSGNQRCVTPCGDYYTSMSFYNDCEKYFCVDHLKWGWGCFCINGCVSSPQCPDHHTGIKCVIL